MIVPTCRSASVKFNFKRRYKNSPDWLIDWLIELEAAPHWHMQSINYHKTSSTHQLISRESGYVQAWRQKDIIFNRDVHGNGNNWDPWPRLHSIARQNDIVKYVNCVVIGRWQHYSATRSVRCLLRRIQRLHWVREGQRQATRSDQWPHLARSNCLLSLYIDVSIFHRPSTVSAETELDFLCSFRAVVTLRFRLKTLTIY